MKMDARFCVIGMCLHRGDAETAEARRGRNLFQVKVVLKEVANA
jgi:hypothetical protein